MCNSQGSQANTAVWWFRYACAVSQLAWRYYHQHVRGRGWILLKLCHELFAGTTYTLIYLLFISIIGLFYLDAARYGFSEAPKRRLGRDLQILLSYSVLSGVLS